MANPFRVLIEWLMSEGEDGMTPKDAIALPAMWYGVNKICDHAGRLPLFIHQKLSGGGSRKAFNHWAYEMVKSKPNAYQTADVFRSQITGHAILWGNGRAAILNRGATQAELIPLLPDRTFTTLVGGQKYHITKPAKDDRLTIFESIKKDKNGTVVLDDSEVIHIQGFGFDGVEGLSLAKMMKRALGIPTAQEKFAERQAKKGFNASVMFEAPKGMFRSEAEAREWIQQTNEFHSSPENAGKAGMLREGMKATVMSMSNEDAQFLEQRRFSRQDVALLLGLDGLPGDGNNRSYNSKEMESLNYLDTGLGPWIGRWESQVDAKILSQADRLVGIYSRYNFSALLRTDAKTQADIINTYISARVLNPNEGREFLDRNPYTGGDNYINPAITPGDGTGKPPAKEPAKQYSDAAIESVRGLIRREASDARNGSNKSDFVGWIDSYYTKWESKLTEKLEALGVDSSMVAEYCEASKEMLLAVAGESTQETLKANVERCVATWQERVFSLMGELENATS